MPVPFVDFEYGLCGPLPKISLVGDAVELQPGTMAQAVPELSSPTVPWPVVQPRIRLNLFAAVLATAVWLIRTVRQIHRRRDRGQIEIAI